MIVPNVVGCKVGRVVVDWGEVEMRVCYTSVMVTLLALVKL